MLQFTHTHTHTYTHAHLNVGEDAAKRAQGNVRGLQLAALSVDVPHAQCAVSSCEEEMLNGEDRVRKRERERERERERVCVYVCVCVCV